MLITFVLGHQQKKIKTIFREFTLLPQLIIPNLLKHFISLLINDILCHFHLAKELFRVGSMTRNFPNDVFGHSKWKHGWYGRFMFGELAKNNTRNSVFLPHKKCQKSPIFKQIWPLLVQVRKHKRLGLRILTFQIWPAGSACKTFTTILLSVKTSKGELFKKILSELNEFN